MSERIQSPTVGRRKSSVARVTLSTGTGTIVVNGRPHDRYFGQATLAREAVLPLVILEVAGKYDVSARVSGGGLAGQSGAIRHALARALADFAGNRPILKKAGLLTRDSRMKERKKYGLRGARKATQWTKR